MSMAYFTIPLSENLEETPEGFLVARDAVVGRTGWQTYKVADLPQESAADLGIDLSNPDADIDLYRPASEVFSPETLASINAKPVTDDHPQSSDGNVHPDNFKEFSCGVVVNAHRGKERLKNGDEPILADVHIQSDPLLSDVRNHVKRELSLGYDYQIRRNGDRIEMHSLVVNHCAVVPKGRAGHEARIRDSAPDAKKGVASGATIVKIETREKRPVKLTWKSIFGEGLKARAADAEPEELADAAVEMASKHAEDLEGYMAGGEFHPIRNSKGYKRSAAGEGRRKRRRAHDADEADSRDRIHDALDRCMDGKADDSDLEQLRDLLDEFFEEEEGEPEHEEDRKADDRRTKDRKAKDRKRTRDSEESAEEEAEQEPKLDVKGLRKVLSDEDEDDDTAHEDDKHEDDADEDEDDPISEEWQEGEPKEDEFEKTSDRKGRAKDGAIEVLKALRPFAAKTTDVNIRRAYDALLREASGTSKVRTGSYGKFAARARAHDTSNAPKNEVQTAAELDAIFAQMRKEGRK